MKIGIDVRYAAKKRRGIGNYIFNLVSELVNIDNENHYFLYLDKDDGGVLKRASNVTIRKLPTVNYLIDEQVLFLYFAVKDKLDVLHLSANTGPLFKLGFYKEVLTIHDVMFLKNDKLIPSIGLSIYQKLGRLYRRLVAPIVSRRAGYVIVNSEFTKQDLLAMVKGVPEHKVFVTHLAHNYAVENKKPKQVNNINKDFILLMGAIEYRKNTQFAIECFLKLIENRKFSGKLAIVGMKKEELPIEVQGLLQAQKENRVEILGFLEDEELKWLFENACFFIYPSLYEGFGLPLLEAMSNGCPVIASNRTSIPEVCGDAALYFDPESKEDCINVMINFLEDKFLREEYASKGRQRAKEFSWKTTAQKTLEIYKRLGESNS